MLKTPFAKLGLNHALSIGIFLVVSLIYFRPIFEGKRLYQNDVYQHEGFIHEAKQYHEQTGEYVAWTNSAFSGMPTNYGLGLFSRNFLASIPYAIGEYLGYFSFDMLLWLMIGMYVLLVVMDIYYWLCIIGAIAFALFSFNIMSIEGGHVMKILQIAFIPPMLAGVLQLFKKKYISGSIIMLSASAISLGINHTQIIYYTIILLFIVSLVFVVDSFIKKDIKHGIIAGTIITIALGLSFGANFSMLNTMEKSKLTTRGESSGLSTVNKSGGLDKDYATRWSYGIAESFTLMVPNLYGGSSTNYLVQDKNSETYKSLRQAPDSRTANMLAQYSSAYFGDQPFVGGGVYVGIVICFLFILGFIFMPNIMKIWTGISFVLFLMLSWGKNYWLYNFFFDHVPLFNKFRVPSMTLSVVQIIMGATAIWGLNYILTHPEDKKKNLRAVQIAGGITGSLLLIFLFMPNIFISFLSPEENELPGWFTNALIADRKGIVRADVIRSLIFALLGVGVLWVYVIGKIKAIPSIIALSLLIIVDLWGVSLRIIQEEKFKKENKNIFAMTQADRMIKQDPDPNYRVLNLASGSPFNDALTSYHHKSIGGYHGAKLRRYQELIEAHISKNNIAVWNMLNTKYIIFTDQNGAPIAQQNPEALGHAWFVNEIKWVNTADEELNALTNDSIQQFDPRKTAILHKEFESKLSGFIPSPDSLSNIRLTKYTPNGITYESNSTKDQLAVFSEVHYVQKDGDGWKAYIDGTPADLLRANYILRALKIPAGQHKIELVYDAGKALSRYQIAFFFSLLVCIIIGGIVFISRKEKFAAYR